MEILSLSITTFILLTLLSILFIWFIIRSAVKSGTKAAILECYTQISRQTTPIKSIEEETQEEIANW